MASLLIGESQLFQPIRIGLGVLLVDELAHAGHYRSCPLASIKVKLHQEVTFGDPRVSIGCFGFGVNIVE